MFFVDIDLQENHKIQKIYPIYLLVFAKLTNIFLDIENKEFISLGGFNDLIKMRDGWMVYNKNDSYVGKSIKEYGEWSLGEIDLLKQILTPNDVIIEVGSNIGSLTLPLSKIVNQGRIYAFEPQNVVFQNLCANISINSITNCFCFQCALTDKIDEKLYNINFNFNSEYNFSSMSFVKTKELYDDKLIDEREFYEANINTLDNKFADLNRLKLLKTDAEGMEVNVIKGGVDLIKRTKPILYVENDLAYKEKSQELIELLWSLDYKLFWHIMPYYNENNFFKNTNNIFKDFYHTNMIGFRKEIKTKTGLMEVTDSSFHPSRSK